MPLVDLPGAIGPSASGLPPTVNSEITSNLILERVETNGKSQYYFPRVPGYSQPVATMATPSLTVSVNMGPIGTPPYSFSANGTSAGTSPASISVNGSLIGAPAYTTGVQASLYCNGRRFFISSPNGPTAPGTLYELTGNGPYALTSWGNVGPLVGTYQQYSMAANIRSNQIGIASGNNTSCFDLTSNTMTSIVTTPEPFIEIDEVDGYFLGLAASGNFYISAFQDGTTWSGLDFVFEETPDLTQTFRVCNRRIWMFGSNHGEAYYDSGNPDFPFTRDSSVYMEIGVYPNSLVVANDTMYGLTMSARGGATAFRLDGATTARISTHNVELRWLTYPTVRDVRARIYQEAGHQILIFDFPSGNESWAFDTVEGGWSERGAWNAATDHWDREWACTHLYDAMSELHFVGDYRNGNIYIQSQKYYDYAGTPIYWRRRFPHVNSDQTGILYDQVRLIMQTGFMGTLPAGVPTTVTLSKSDDGGGRFTTPQYPVNAGTAGEFNRRLDWYGQGYSTDRVFEIRGNDPIPLAIVALKGAIRVCQS